MITPTLEEMKQDIIGWMHHSIPRGKTIPIFEDLVDNLVTTAKRETLREVRKQIDEHDPNVKMGRETNPAYWGNTLREALTHLESELTL